MTNEINIYKSLFFFFFSRIRHVLQLHHDVLGIPSFFYPQAFMHNIPPSIFIYHHLDFLQFPSYNCISYSMSLCADLTHRGTFSWHFQLFDVLLSQYPTLWTMKQNGKSHNPVSYVSILVFFLLRVVLFVSGTRWHLQYYFLKAVVKCWPHVILLMRWKHLVNHCGSNFYLQMDYRIRDICKIHCANINKCNVRETKLISEIKK